MTKMHSFRLPKDVTMVLRQLADRHHGGNQTRAVIEAILHYHAELNPPICQGYVQVNRTPGNGKDNVCAHCSGPLSESVWMAVYSNGMMGDMLCAGCVQDDTSVVGRER